MDVPFLLSKAQMRRIEPFFPLPHGVPRVDDRRIVSAIIYVIKHGLMWRDAPKDFKKASQPAWRRSKGGSWRARR